MNNGAHYQYKKKQVEGVDQGTLIVMLYDGAIKFLSLANEAIDSNDVETAHNNFVRAQAIITEL
ncbi:flagellar export chaperone FliS, partial [Thermodesulfobacteriota bacterium]